MSEAECGIIGYTHDLRAVRKDGERLFMVIHDAKRKRHEIGVKPAEIIHGPTLHWDENLRRHVE